MESLLLWIQKIIETHGSWGVFFISILEEVIAPIPSTLTTMGAGFLLLGSYETFLSVLLPALIFVAIPVGLGMALGGMLIYGIAYLGEEIIIDRWGKWFGISRDSVARLKGYFQSGYRDEMILLFLRGTPIFPNSLISGVCGLIHYPIRSFFLLSFLGGVMRALPISLLGWWAKEAYVEYAGVFSGLEGYILIGVAILALGLIFLIATKKKKRKA